MSIQFELTRGSLLKFVQELDEQTADAQPNGFNNTIRWHIGHVLVSAESFLFGYPKKSMQLPVVYGSLFGMGTKPSHWSEAAPSLEILLDQLNSQTQRIRELSPAFFEEKLPFKFPVGNIETYSDLYLFMLFHEADHLGQMKAMKRIIQSY